MPAPWLLLSADAATPISQFFRKHCLTASHLAPSPRLDMQNSPNRNTGPETLEGG